MDDANLEGTPPTVSMVIGPSWRERQEGRRGSPDDVGAHAERPLSGGYPRWFAPLVTTVPAGEPSAEWFDRLPPRHPD
jgi:hypothetical protein